MKILLVDDDESIRMLTAQVLSSDGHEVTERASVEDALKIFRKGEFAIVITDIVMEGMSGMDLLKEVKQRDPDTQVIVLTSYPSLETAVLALHHGAYDYLIKTYDQLDFIADVVARAAEKVKLASENRSLIENLKDETDRLEQAHISLRDMVLYDSVTGLMNDTYFNDILERECARGARSGKNFSLIVIHIDDLKKYRERQGAVGSNQMLSVLAHLIENNLRKSDCVARSGDERFMVLLFETGKDGALCVARKIGKLIADHPILGQSPEQETRISVSMGVVASPEDGASMSALLRNAELAIERAARGDGSAQG
ncbi:MAG: diguanylate cyclase domain-containing protein [bacterium]